MNTPEEKQAAIQAYKAKREARIERYEDRAASAQDKGEALVNGARKMASVIPFGQPILVGHHSERGDRNYRGRIDNKFRAGFSELEKAKYYERRAASAASNTAIFSDDPAACDKIAEKIAKLEKRQELMRTANKLFRKSDREGLAELGFSEAVIQSRLTPDFCGRIGFPNYELTNNGANIRRLKLRLGNVEKAQSESVEEKEIGAVRLVDNPHENRFQIFFPDKPSDECRTELKRSGFRWSPQNGCWQAYRSGKYWGEQVVAKFYGTPADEIAGTHSDFQARIKRIAAAADLESAAVFALWKEYSKNCQNSDQSALLAEFVEWYKEKLGGNSEVLRAAIDGDISEALAQRATL